MQISVSLIAFAATLSVALPDRPFAVTHLLGTRYPPLPVWLGAVGALLVPAAVAAATGVLLAGLPRRPVALCVAAVLVGAALPLLRGAGRAAERRDERQRAYADRIALGRRGTAAAGAAFLAVLGQWGPLSALPSATLVAVGGPAHLVLTGSGAALATVAALAVRPDRWPRAGGNPAVSCCLAATACLGLAALAGFSGTR
jgi:putative Ca2+/H+ antiporter (TMEM165/GDT1 family)